MAIDVEETGEEVEVDQVEVLGGNDYVLGIEEDEGEVEEDSGLFPENDFHDLGEVGNVGGEFEGLNVDIGNEHVKVTQCHQKESGQSHSQSVVELVYLHQVEFDRYQEDQVEVVLEVLGFFYFECPHRVTVNRGEYFRIHEAAFLLREHYYSPS